MRSPFWRIGVFVVVLVWPLLWLYQAWEDTLGPDRARYWSIDWGWGRLFCCS